jgi:Ca2+-binding RTX toxin-like protein
VRRVTWLAVLLVASASLSANAVGQGTRSAHRCTIKGTEHADVIRGTTHADLICALGGDDVVDGRGGNDVLYGGGGSDVMRGGPGNDKLRGGGGRGDELYGGTGDDVLDGGEGDDVLYGGPGKDQADGGTGDDLFLALDGERDLLQGGPGRDGVQFDRGRDHTRGMERAIAALSRPDPVVLTAGDISSCAKHGDEQTAPLLDLFPTATVVTAGDNVYEGGDIGSFRKCFEPSWGRAKARTRPAIGSHEYSTPDAAGYFAYFGAAAGEPGKGYYSFDLGAWHIVMLNTLCAQIGGCSSPSLEVQWLEGDLTAHPAQCTLAVMHHPRFSSRHGAPRNSVHDMWEILYRHGAELVISGDDHLYERFAPQNVEGDPDPAAGIRQFIVGTGGRSHHSITSVRPNSEARETQTYGILKLTLQSSSYSWEFVPVAGKTFADAGTTPCH